MEVVPEPDGRAVLRLLDMDSAEVVELRGCQRERLQDEVQAWLAVHEQTAMPAGEFFVLGARLAAAGCTCPRTGGGGLVAWLSAWRGSARR